MDSSRMLPARWPSPPAAGVNEVPPVLLPTPPLVMMLHCPKGLMHCTERATTDTCSAAAATTASASAAATS
jgi:hypothetical protein